jgi:hypothetical protein
VDADGEGVRTEGVEGVRTNGPDRRRVNLVISASSYPFLNVLWDILIFFAWVIFIWIAITVLIDVFRRHDISGWGKAGWVVFVVILPWIGVLTYLIVNHTGMAERRAQDTQAAQAQFDQYVRQTAGTGGPASEIQTAKQLLDNGTITQEEFEAIKAKAVGTSSP